MIFIIIFVILFFTFIFWSAHITMIKDECYFYGWAGFRKFKREFVKRKWTVDDLGSLDGNDGSMIYADIISFDGQGMIINNPFSYLIYRIYTATYRNKNKRKLNKHKENRKVKW